MGALVVSWEMHKLWSEEERFQMRARKIRNVARRCRDRTFQAEGRAVALSIKAPCV